MYKSSFRLITWLLRLRISKNCLFISILLFSKPLLCDKTTSLVPWWLTLMMNNILNSLHMHFYFYSPAHHFALPFLFCSVLLLPLPLCLSLSFSFIFLLAFLVLTIVGRAYPVVGITEKKILNSSVVGIWHLRVSKKSQKIF